MNKYPSRARYQVALLQLEQEGVPLRHRAMLQAHYASGSRGLTAGELAQAAGYRNHMSVNVQYGTFAGRLARALGVSVDPLPNLAILATWNHDKRSWKGHLFFPMRPQLARALEAVEWVIGAAVGLEPDQDIVAAEGQVRLLLVKHRVREARLREAKIADSMAKSSDGRLRCEVPGCGFDFEAVYGKLGHGFAHVHHLGGLRSPRLNRLRDLAIVCANCHAMIHRGGQNRPLKNLIPGLRRQSDLRVSGLLASRHRRPTRPLQRTAEAAAEG